MLLHEQVCGAVDVEGGGQTYLSHHDEHSDQTPAFLPVIAL